MMVSPMLSISGKSSVKQAKDRSRWQITMQGKSTLHLAPLVIDEIRVQGSRCGPFSPALRALSQKLVDVRPLISAGYPLDEGLTAFQYAGQKGALKVLVRV